jgi:hypothetical protein
MLTLNLIGKESNRLDERAAGLIGNLDDAIATYASPTEHAWTHLVMPALDDFATRDLATLANLDTSTLQRIKRGAVNRPHVRNRALLTIVTAELAATRLEAWDLTVPTAPLERLASYLDHRDEHTSPRRCICGNPLAGRQRAYCSERCKKRAYRTRREATLHNKRELKGGNTMSTVGGIFPPAPS